MTAAFLEDLIDASVRWGHSQITDMGQLSWCEKRAAGWTHGRILWRALAISYFYGQVERVLTQTKNLTTWIMLCAVLSKAEWWRRQEKKLKASELSKR